MEILQIAGTGNTPSIKLDHVNHKLEFAGESRPDNVREFFAPVYKWVQDYKNYVFYIANESKDGVNVLVEFKMEYFNSSSVRVFNEILTEIKHYSTENNKIHLTINWHHEPDDIDNQEAGEEFADLIKMPINIISGGM